MKDCGNAIKDIIKFDKTPNTSNQSNPCTKERSVSASRKETRCTPDIITSNRISFGRSREEPIVRYSKLLADEGDSLKHRHSVSVGTFCTESNGSDSQNCTGQDQMSESLLIFLALEKQIGEEFSQANKQYNTPNRRNEKKEASFNGNLLVDDNETGRGNSRDDSREAREMISTRRKISAEPFLSRSQKSAGMFWEEEEEEEDDDDSLPERVWNYLDLNTSAIMIGTPCRNSTFCEETPASDLNRSGEVVADDSGFGNNNSVLYETI